MKKGFRCEFCGLIYGKDFTHPTKDPCCIKGAQKYMTRRITMDYDPNMLRKSRCVRTIKLMFGSGEHRATRIVEIGGNCDALTAIQDAVESVDEDIRVNYDRDTWRHPHILLKKGGRRLIVEYENNEGDWLKEMLIKAEIIKIEMR